MEYVKISEIKPAEYNPRVIKAEQFETLKASIKKLGFILPVIINSDNMTIIAGHQRTKAAKALGFSKVPAVFVRNVPLADEVRFNQIHNACSQASNSGGFVKTIFSAGFSKASFESFVIESVDAEILKESCRLINKYGNCLCCVICEEKIIFADRIRRLKTLRNVGTGRHP